MEYRHEDETLEDLQRNGLRILQKKAGFRFGMDAVLLADFARVRPGDLTADIGTGTGILPLLMVGRGKGKLFYAFEKQPEMADMARRSVELNGLEERIKIINDDAANISNHLKAQSLDAVVCNPPFITAKQGTAGADPARAMAMHQEEDTLSIFLKAASYALKGKGKLFMVFNSENLAGLFTALGEFWLEPKKIRMVHAREGLPARRVLLEAVKDGKPGLEVTYPLILQTSDGSLTNELESIYNN